MSRWQRYWFAEGGRTSLAVVRIAVALATLMVLQLLATLSTVEIPGPPELYRPVGIWMIFGRWVPPDAVFTLLWILAFTSTVAMLFGLATRIATAVSFVTAVALASASYASSASWSHPFNVVLLAHLALLGARAGDTLSLDEVIRIHRGLPPVNVPRGYQWSLRLVQLAVALMFFGAAWHKLRSGGLGLRWALSDNLRHHLLVRYDLAGLDRPPLVDWLLEESWRYRAAALGNLFSQAAPFFACVFVRRPLVRLACGGIFALEVLGLGLVVTLWNYHWFPLVAVFVDWEWLLGKLRLPVREPPPTPPARDHRRATQAFIIVYLVYYAATAFIPSIDQRLNTYPFSAFPMFASIRATPPLDQHMPYSVPGDRYEVTSDRPISVEAQRWFDHHNRWLYDLKDPAMLETRMRSILAAAQARYPEAGIRGLRHRFMMFEVPAYPAEAHFEPRPIATLAELRPDGTFRSVFGTLGKDTVELRPQNVDAKSVRLVYYLNDLPVAHQLQATREGNRFVTGPLKGKPLTVIAIIDGEPWLAARRKK